MFEHAGIREPPKDWQKLFEDAKKLTNNGKYGIGLPGKQSNDLSWTLAMFIYAGGAQLVSRNEDGSYSVALNTSQGRNAVKFYLKLMQECSPSDSAEKTGKEIMDDFRNQKIAMEFQGPWGVTDIWKSGNQFLEGLFAKVPMVVYEYPVFEADIKKTGFDIVSLGNKHSVSGDKLVCVDKKIIEKAGEDCASLLFDSKLRQSVVEKNFTLGLKNYSYSALSAILESIFRS